MQEIKPVGMICYAGSNKGDSKNIKHINNQQAKRDKPEFFEPGSTRKSYDTKTNKRLFNSGTCPDDQYRIPI